MDSLAALLATSRRIDHSAAPESVSYKRTLFETGETLHLGV